jgi:hypothetical protein
MSLLSDCLRAVTGMFPRGLDAADIQKAHELPALFERRLKAWLTAPQEPFLYHPPPKDMEELFTRLTAKPTSLESEAWMQVIGTDDPDTSVGFFEGIVRSRVYLVGDLLTQQPGIWPTLSISTPAGPEPLPLSADDAGDMAAVYAVLNDPRRLLDEMDQGTLEPAQATAFRELFPDLYDHVGKTLQAAIAEQRAKHPSWGVSWQKDGILRVLKGMPPEEQFTAPPPPPPPNPKLELHAERDATQGDLAQTPVGRENPAGA